MRRRIILWLRLDDLAYELRQTMIYALRLAFRICRFTIELGLWMFRFSLYAGGLFGLWMLREAHQGGRPNPLDKPLAQVNVVEVTGDWAVNLLIMAAMLVWLCVGFGLVFRYDPRDKV